MQQTSITAMASIKKNLDEWDGVSNIYLGTEAGRCRLKPVFARTR